jgi:uncharacterized protein YdeI (YjbR/CyaY-like superfamily)
MGQKSPATDAYIANAPDYARPILKKVRTLFHKADPQIIESTKWGVPAFERDGLVAMMAAFKSYVGVNFWRQKHLTHRAANAFDGRFASIEDLPSDADFIACVKEAISLNAPGKKPKRAVRPPRAALPVPADLTSALKQNPRARTAFDAFPPSHRREYIEWITGAKQATTREKRLDQAVTWIAQGKSRNWKYQ